jgi:two-component system phosphate regulon sensor histidine kinase PhoR
MRSESLYEFGFSAFKRTGASAGEAYREPGPFKRLEEERRRLVTMLAHDLKIPVVASLGLLNCLRHGKKGSLTEVQADYVNTIYKQIQRVEKLIDKFLDFASVDLHFITPETTAIQAEEECREILVLLQPLPEAKGIELEAEFPEEILVLPANPLLFRRALENLLVNAIKYSPPRSCVVLEVQGTGPEVQFAVRDQGPGIPSQDLPHLFEVFYRGAASCQEQGFGLGLATVKRIIEAHGGRIWVETTIGQGTTFFFTLPR